MPKKFKGENSKAAEAKARKTAQKHEEQERKQKELEDEMWRDDDKHVARKQQRKGDKEKKRQEQIDKKKELQKLHDEEMESIKPKKAQPAPRITRADIDKNLENERKEKDAAAKREQKTTDELPIEENVNRLTLDGDEARNVDEALSLLSSKEKEVDLHPEKRMKAAYRKYEDDNLPILKQENPHMKLSQLKQMLWKDWQKSPENPLNQS